MKKVLITGKNSYVGLNFKSYAEKKYSTKIQAKCVSVRGENWQKLDFSKYDTVLHVAALVHKNERKHSLNEYQAINKDLTIKIAKMAKSAHVGHFIFMSTIAVYGTVEDSKITTYSTLDPVSKYGKSKLEAEQELKRLESDDFVVTIVRPPMIYGPNCPGNYNNLSRLASVWGIYPKFSNQRSMIYIDNLAEFLSQLTIKKLGGIYLPQNSKYVSTSDLIQLIRQNNGKKTFFIRGLSSIVNIMVKHNSILNKVYGSLKIDFELSKQSLKYNKVKFNTSIKMTKIRRTVNK
ncbi:NAD-dependent epimerase/dehydratase family protein [Pediococcus cellicola]|uniref:Sugar transferase n=1 Tax=Pediococcus cellicola TaxID=319652 RepID=A0A0R2ILU6_9LACO|nr:NAD-dependent epimerase/dehydratase family protein [Pediococcus cellicola]KRN66057.1 sugar transferase [Pediococcus cellicola]GEL15472.1 UDP-glucose 4-epimerase [Pediococcus cellicola]